MSAAEENSQQNDESLKNGLGVSFILHAILLSFFTLKAVFFTPESIDFSQAVRVDMVGLPDKTTPKEMPPAHKEEAKPAPQKEAAKETPKEKPAPEPTPVTKIPPKVAQKDPDAINLEKVKSKQQNAMDKLKAMAALDKIKEEVAAEKKKDAGHGKKDEGSQAIKGNQVSAGDSLTGLNKLQHDTYVSDLDRHIKQHWSLPEWLAKRDLKAQVRVQVDARGLVIGKKIVKSSGNPSYDDEVLATIEKSSPFPAPPAKFVSLLESEGILIGFPE